MAKNPFNNIEKEIRSQPVSAFPLEGQIDDYPVSDEYEIDNTPQGVEAPVPDMPMDSDVSEIEMMDDGSAVVTLGEEDKSITISLGFGDNLAAAMDDTRLARISSDLLSLIEDDDAGREEWRKAYEQGLTLLGLVYEDRTEPFQGATGVIHPILNEAVVQFQAQAYKELLPPGGPVRTQILGVSTPEVEAQADRVKQYMNYQITEVMEEFDPEYDQMLYFVGYGGSAFKKVYYDGYLGRATSPVIQPKDLIVPYGAKDLATAERVTHVLRMSRNDLLKMQKNGFYRNIDIEEPTQYEQDDITQRQDQISGMEQSAYSDEYILYECHCNYDITEQTASVDDENVAVPYIITLEKQSGKVLSIRRNYKENDPLKKKKQYFVHYKFLPGLGFYGSGLVHLLGNLSRSSTSLLRQLIDAGTLSNLPGGFKAKGLRIQDQDSPIQPGEWRDIDAPGGDLSQSLLPLPYKEPSATLYQLLGFCITAAEKFVGTTDLGMAEGNQEVPVGTTIAVLERGARVMSAVHKRLHYAQKQELRLLAQVFAEYTSPEYPYDVYGAERSVKQSDFDNRVDIIPVSDPNIFSMTQRITLAQEQLKLAGAAPQMHDMHEAYRRMYAALGVQDIDSILKPVTEPQPVGPAQENSLLLNVPNGAQSPKVFPQQNHAAHIQIHVGLMQTPLVQSTPGALAAVMAHIYEHIGFAAQQQVLQGQQIGPNQQVNPQIEAQIAMVEVQIAQQVFGGQQNTQEDPLVALKSRELDIRQQENMRKAQESDQRLSLDARKMREKQQIDLERIQTTEDIAKMRVEAQLMKNGLM
jgi:hypothetical protein